MNDSIRVSPNVGFRIIVTGAAICGGHSIHHQCYGLECLWMTLSVKTKSEKRCCVMKSSAINERYGHIRYWTIAPPVGQKFNYYNNFCFDINKNPACTWAFWWKPYFSNVHSFIMIKFWKVLGILDHTTFSTWKLVNELWISI